MNNLSNIVTGALSLGEGEEEESAVVKSASEVYESRCTAWEAFQTGREAEETLPSLSGKPFHKEMLEVATKYLSYSKTIQRPRYYYSDNNGDSDAIDPSVLGIDLLLRTGDYLHNPSARSKKDLLSFLHQANDEMEIYLMQGIDERLEYIKNLWEKDASRIVSECCNVTKATASNWLRGNKAGHSAVKVSVLVRVVVHLKSTVGMNDQKTRDWIETPLAEGKTPIELIENDYKFPAPIRDFLRSKGVVILDWSQENRVR